MSRNRGGVLMKWILAWAGISLLAGALVVIMDTVLLHSIAIPNEPSGGLLGSILYNLQYVMKAIFAFVAIALLVAFVVSEIFARFLPVRLRTLAITVGGLLAIPVLFWAMKQAFFGIDILAGAREWWGYAAQAVVSGAIPAYLFGRITTRRRRSRYAVD